MAQSRMYLRCEICGKDFYLARLSSMCPPEELGVYDAQFETVKVFQTFLIDHGHDLPNGNQYTLDIG